jgi:para-nitrobenzyl esterase
VTSDAPVVRTSGGLVRGVVADGVAAFRGVPYATPREGGARFAVPEPARWDGTRDCTAFGEAAPQPQVPLFSAAGPMGPDHLHVNVCTPDIGAAGLPVLVWIHGGAWVTGSNADPWSQGEALSRRGIVVVSANYRLGLDGFLVVDDGASNRGVRDWLAALEWVRENVSAFGGDPDRVTIGGQSAGSAACLVLATLPAARGLFRRVFAMSGVPWNVVGVDEARALASDADLPRTVDSLLALPVADLLELQQKASPPGGVGGGGTSLDLFRSMATQRTWIGPVVDGDLVPAHPMDAIAAGGTDELDLLIGTTGEEVDGLLRLQGDAPEASEAEGAMSDIGISPSDAAGWLHERSPRDALGAALTARAFGGPTLRMALDRAAPTFVYETVWSPPTLLGAVHAIDIPYFFSNLGAPALEMLAGGPPPEDLSAEMSAALLRFVETGDPGWPAFTPDAAVMRFDRPSVLATGLDQLRLRAAIRLEPRGG